MRIIIIGAGFTGIQLAKRLIAEQNNVVLIDNNEDTVRHASNRLDCMVIQANGNNIETLKDAGLAKADALIALTDSDEVNMITCSLADAVYPHVKKIARVRNYDYYTSTLENAASGKRPVYGIDAMVHPDVEAAEAISAAVERGAATDIIDFDNSAFDLTCIPIEKHSKFDGVCLQDLHRFTKSPFLVAFVEKDQRPFIPSGATILNHGNRIGIITSKQCLPEFLELCGSEIQTLRKIALLGAGRIGTIVAERLIKETAKKRFRHFFNFKKTSVQQFYIIDSDEKRAKEAAEHFPSANVFHADITDESFIQEEDIGKFDLVITATHNHELNMVTAAYLKSLGVERTVCLVSSSAFGAIARKIGVNVAIPIKDAVVDSIMSHLRGKSITEVHTIADGGLETLELTIPADSEAAGKTLREIARPGEFLILLHRVAQTSEYAIPSGNTVIKPGDSIIVIVKSEDNHDVMESFGVLNA